MEAKEDNRKDGADVWEESRRKVKTWILAGIGSAMPAISLLFVSPFYSFVGVGALLILVAALILAVLAYMRRRFLLLGAAVAMATCAMLWSFFGQIIFVPGPVYVYVDTDGKPWETKIIKLSDTFPGSLFILSDPIRRTLFPVVASRLRPSDVRIFKLERIGNEQHLRFPFLAALVYPTRTIDGAQNNLVTVPMTTATLNVNVKAERMPNSSSLKFKNLTVDMSPDIYDLLIFRERESRQDLRWNLIKIDGDLEKTLHYAALLDNAIFEAAQGDPYKAAAVFGVIMESHLAPNRIEELRTAVMLGSLFRGLLGGSVGGLQSLIVFHNAYSLLAPKLDSGAPLEPLEKWAAMEIAAKYLEYPEVFAERIVKLRLRINESSSDSDDDPSIRDILKLGKSATLKEFWSAAQKLDAPFPLPGSLRAEENRLMALSDDALKKELRAIKDQNAVAAEISLALDSLDENLTESRLRDRTAVLQNEAKRLPKQFASMIERHVRLAYDKAVLMNRILVAERDSEPIDRESIKILSTYCKPYFPITTDYVVMFLAMKPDEEEKIRKHLSETNPNLTYGSNDDWWSARYLDRFAANLIRWSFYDGDNKGADTLISGVSGGYSAFVKDGRQRPFTPAFALIVLFTESDESTLRRNAVSNLARLAEADPVRLLSGDVHKDTLVESSRAVLTREPIF